MKLLFPQFLITAMVVWAGCSPSYNRITSDFDRSADFSGYKTFAWLPDKADTVNTPYNNEIIRNNIRNYFGQCMSDRGYTFEAEKPDLLLQLVVSHAQKERVVTTTYPIQYYYRPYYLGSLYYYPYQHSYYYRYYPTYVPASYGPAYSTTQSQAYVNGALTLNFIDRASRKLVWTGTAEGDIYDPSLISRDLHPAVHRILDDYPVKPLVRRNHKIK